VKVGLSSVVLMMIGFTIFYAGYIYIDNNLLIFPLEKLFNTPPRYLVQKPLVEDAYTVDATYDAMYIYISKELKVKNNITIYMSTKGYLIVEAQVGNRTQYIALPTLILFVGIIRSDGVEIVYSKTFSDYLYTIIYIEEKGTYFISVRASYLGIRYDELYSRPTLETSEKKIREGVNCIISYKAIGLFPKQEYIIAKWMQGLGFVLFMFGLLVFLFSPLIVSRYATATYSIPPEEIRRELAGLGIMQLFETSRKKKRRE